MAIKKIRNPFRDLTKFEWCLWLGSMIIVAISFAFLPEKNYLSLIASLIGVTALIFIAKGKVIGQFLIIAFALLYAVVSFRQGYYGEVMTYAGMSAPMAVLSIISWLKNPYKKTKTVKIKILEAKHYLIGFGITAAVTCAFYFILGALGTSNIVFSTLSVATSFYAVYLTFLRSPYHSVAYLANDLVLIVLWVLASIKKPSYIPMIVCFFVFLANDTYGFISWKRMEKYQQKN